MKTVFFPADKSIQEIIQGFLYIDYNYKEPSQMLMTAKGTCVIALPLSTDFTFKNEGPKLKKNEIPDNNPLVPLLYGQMTSYGLGHVDSHIKFLFIVFTPTGLYKFLCREINPFTNCILRAENILPLNIQLDEIIKLYEAKGIDSVLNYLKKILKDFIHQLPEENASTNLDFAIRAIHQGLGKVQISDLAAMYGKTQRSFELQFKKQVGIPPKVYCRITRFNQLLFQLSETPNLDSFEWIEKFGYTDQSHFIKDFRDFTGMTPRKYFKSDSWENQVIDKAIRN